MNPALSELAESLRFPFASIAWGFLGAIVAGWIWFVMSKFLMRQKDGVWNRELYRLESNAPSTAIDQRIKGLVQQRAFVGHGSPSDRLFFAGMAVAAIGALFVLAFRGLH